MSKLLSIIIPVYNAEKYLDQCVRSIMNQGLRKEDFELIMVNDGSTDNSLEVAKRLKEEFNNADITIIDQKNQGSGAARNKGISIAKGKYIEFVDSDDYLEGDSIKVILDIAIKADLDVIAFRIKYYDKEGNEHISRPQPLPVNKILSAKDILVRGLIIGSVCENLYKKSFLQKNGIFFPDSIYHEDVVYSSCVCASVTKIMFTHYCPYVYRWNPDSKDRSQEYAKRIKSTIDELYVIKYISFFISQKELTKKIKVFFQQRNNSSLVSILIHIIMDKKIPKEAKKRVVLKAKELGIYPIRGCTNSVLTSLLVPFLNNRIVIKMAINGMA